MPNKKLALEWLEKAWHDLESARILFDANHFTDVIGIDLQQGIEKTLKSLLAYQNKKIIKTHNLIILADESKNLIFLNEDQTRLFELATLYYKEGRYPDFNTEMPEKKDIIDIMNLAYNLYYQAVKIVDNQNKP